MFVKNRDIKKGLRLYQHRSVGTRSLLPKPKK